MNNLKLIVFRVIFYLLIWQCYSNDLSINKLNGSVKSVLSKTYVTNGDVILKLDAYSEKYFDEEGFFIKIKEKLHSDEGFSTTDYKRISDTVIEFTNGGISLPVTYKKTYDENGRLIESLNTDQNFKRLVKDVYTYDKNNNLETWICFDRNNSIEYKHYFLRNSLGKPLEIWEFTKESNYLDKVLISKLFYDENSTLIRSIKYNRVNRDVFEDLTYKTILNKNGTIKHQKVFRTEDGALLKIYSYKYDKYKNVTVNNTTVYEYINGIKHIKEYLSTYKKYTYY